MINGITQLKRELEDKASLAEGYKRNERTAAQITLFANRYCECKDKLAADPNDEEAKWYAEIYMAALVLKFWDRIKWLYDETKTVGHMEYEDFVSVLFERIEYACKYRKWQEPNSKTNAQACINQAIATEKLNIFYFANLDKNRANAAAIQVSFDQPIAGDEESKTLADITEDDYESSNFDDIGTRATIQSCIDDGDYFSAIIADTFAFGDCEKITKEVKTVEAENGETADVTFEHATSSDRLCVKFLSNLPDNYREYFMNHYDIDKPEAFDAVLERIKSSKSTRLYKYIDAFRAKFASIYAD